MTTPTKNRVVKTPGQRLCEYRVGMGDTKTEWQDCVPMSRESYEIEAKDLGIQPIEEDVPEPPKTDGELLVQATDNCSGHVFLTSEADDVAAEFLRLRAERDGVHYDHADPDNTGCCIKCQLETEKWLDDDGEPLEVTGDFLYERWNEKCLHADSPWDVLAEWINAHRGVRPVQIPQVTPEMLNEALKLDAGLWHITAYLNDKLAKQAGKAGG